MGLLGSEGKTHQIVQAKIRHNGTRTVMAFTSAAFDDRIQDAEHMGSSDTCTEHNTVHLEHECEELFDLAFQCALFSLFFLTYHDLFPQFLFS